MAILVWLQIVPAEAEEEFQVSLVLVSSYRNTVELEAVVGSKIPHMVGPDG